MHLAKFGASVKGGENLSRIEPVLWIKGAFDTLLLFQIGLAEHGVHQITLFNTNPVFASQHAADRHTELENICPKSLCFFHVSVFVGIIKNKRVQIAVPGMKDIGAAQAIFF